MKDWRLFLAAVVPPPAGRAVWDALRDARLRHPAARWVAPTEMHVTLLFLGATPPTAVAAISRTLARTAAASEPATLRTGAGGGRAGPRHGGVAWLGLEGPGVAVLSRVGRELDAGIAAPAKGARHAPHLTVARRVTRELLDDLAAESVDFEVAHVALFRSRTEAAGARYESLAQAVLGAGPAGADVDAFVAPA